MNLPPLSQLNGVARAEITDLTADGCKVARPDRPYLGGGSKLWTGMPVHRHGDDGEMTVDCRSTVTGHDRLSRVPVS